MGYSISKKECEIIMFFQQHSGFQRISECTSIFKLTHNAFLQILLRMKQKKLISYAIQKANNSVYVEPKIKIVEVE